MTGGMPQLGVNGPLNWPVTGIDLPEMPMLPPGEDPLSAMISALLPTMAAPLAAQSAALSAKEGMFSGKLDAATAQYGNTEDAGQQGVMQIVQMLGQLGGQAGQMGQMVGAPGKMFGQVGSQFGQLMQPMMQAFQGAGHGGQGQAQGGQGGAGMAGQGPGGVAGAQQQGRDEGRTPAQAAPDSERDERNLAGPGETRHGLSPMPVQPPGQQQPGHGEDPSRRL